MTTTKTLLAAAILGLIALAGNSQAAEVAPALAGTYQDSTLSIPQRIELAHAIVTNETAGDGAVRAAGSFILYARPVVHLVQLYPDFADSVISDPTLGGKAGDNSLWVAAINWKVDCIAALDDKITYLATHLDSTIPTAAQADGLRRKYGDLVAAKAGKLFSAQDYAGAIALASPVANYSGNAISIVFKSKLALRSPDVLEWAKLVYVVTDFQHTQDGIDAVSSAFRSLDTSLVRANAFIQFEKDGKGESPIAGVDAPKVTFLGDSASSRVKTMAAAGDNIGALKVAISSFASAPSGNPLNAATALVAQCLRNIDGNLVRANAFVEAQSQGKPFTIAELQ